MVAVIAYFLIAGFRSNLSIDSDNGKINITPEQITSMEKIGQWEFLSVADEELVDTMRAGFFSDDRLVRIYYGTLRLGIDMRKARKGWVKAEGDSLVVTLPPVELLDENFIDEARTKAFFETGSWEEADRMALTDKARRMMRQRCLTKENITEASNNARLQFEGLFHSMGVEKVCVKVGGK